MPDLLDFGSCVSNRTGRSSRRLPRRRVLFSQASPDASKLWFRAIRSMATTDVVRADLSRAVFEIVRHHGAAAPNSEGSDELIDAWDFELRWAWSSASIDRPDQTPARSFLENARRLDEHRQTDAALDLIFDQIDEMLLAGKFVEVDQLLQDISPSDYSVELLLGILTATLPAKDELSSRAQFFQQVREVLRERGELKEGLLVGLD